MRCSMVVVDSTEQNFGTKNFCQLLWPKSGGKKKAKKAICGKKCTKCIEAVQKDIDGKTEDKHQELRQRENPRYQRLDRVLYGEDEEE